MTLESKPKPSWTRWLSRAVLAVVAVIAVLVMLPMLKGMYYGLVPPAPLPADQLPAWRYDYDAALAESAESGRPVLIDFTASWCPPCKVMEAEVWPDDAVRTAIAERVIPLKLDVDEPTSAGPAQRYGIQYIPTLVLVDADGVEIARGGSMSAGGMVEFVEEHAERVAHPTTQVVQ